MSRSADEDCPMNEQTIGFVLHALEPAEEIQVLRHLPQCASCRAVVGDAEGVFTRMGASVEQVDPPPSLRASLMARVAQTPQVQGRPRRPQPDRPASNGEASAAPGVPAPNGQANGTSSSSATAPGSSTTAPGSSDTAPGSSDTVPDSSTTAAGTGPDSVPSATSASTDSRPDKSATGAEADAAPVPSAADAEAETLSDSSTAGGEADTPSGSATPTVSDPPTGDPEADATSSPPAVGPEPAATSGSSEADTSVSTRPTSRRPRETPPTRPGPSGRSDASGPPSRRSWSSRRGRLIAAAVALIGVLAIGGLAVRTAQLQEQRDAELAQSRTMTELLDQLGRPGTTYALLAEKNGPTLAAVVLADGERQVYPLALPANTTESDIYVLWGLDTSGTPQPLGTFDVVQADPGLREVGTGAAADAFAQYAISLEPGRAAPATPTKVVASGAVTA